MMPAAICWHSRLVRRRLADYLALAKPRVVLMVLVTTTVGYVLGSAAPPAFLPIGRLLVGTALAAAGSLALTHWLERDLDARMARPRVAGWPSVNGQLGPEPWVLAGIMFLWQITHTLAIGHLYRQDYARAGMRLLPVLDEGGGSTSLQAFNNCLALLPVGLLPSLIGLTGSVYLVLSTVLALGFLWTAARFVQDRSAPAARRLLMASLVYLPALLAVMAFDRQGH